MKDRLQPWYAVRYSLITFAWLLMTASYAQDAALKTKVEAKLKAFAAVPGLKNAVWGFGLWDCTTGKPVVLKQGNTLMTTASTVKALTTAAALDKFGPHHRIITRLTVSPTTIYIEGGGDPSLGSEYLGAEPEAIINQWADKLKPELQGKPAKFLHADMSGWEPNWPAGYLWTDLGNYYGAGPRQVSWMDNMCRLKFGNGKLGHLAQVETVEPAEADRVKWLSQVKFGPEGSGDQAYAYGMMHDRIRYINGTIPVTTKGGFSIKVAMPEPELVLLNQLKAALGKKGIQTQDCYTTSPWSAQAKPLPKDAGELVYEHVGPTMAELVSKTNQHSLNHFADALLLKLGEDKSGRSTYKSGLEELENFCKKEMKMPDDQVFLADGSGLGPDNQVSVSAFGQFLLNARKQSWFSSFEQSLAITGKTGTMKDYGKGTPAEGNLILKTGSVTRVQNYVGYFTSKSGKKYAVVLMVNRFTGTFKNMRKATTDFLIGLPAF